MHVILISHLGRYSLYKMNLDLRGLSCQRQYHHHQHHCKDSGCQRKDCFTCQGAWHRSGRESPGLGSSSLLLNFVSTHHSSRFSALVLHPRHSVIRGLEQLDVATEYYHQTDLDNENKRLKHELANALALVKKMSKKLLRKLLKRQRKKWMKRMLQVMY